MTSFQTDSHFAMGGHAFSVSRPHPFGLVIGGAIDEPIDDYLHSILLAPENRNEFLGLIETERLVVCKNVHSNASSYRKVRGKSSSGKLSQAEYYHHDGCSCPTKPRIVEIRLPHQPIERTIATAIAPFASVMAAMLKALPSKWNLDPEIQRWIASFLDRDTELPATESWDKIQGRLTRMVRRELDAESCRDYFRSVDQLANAYDLPWEMGESRLMLNDHSDLSRTMQHRRACQPRRSTSESNGSLVKRWTAEEA